MAYPIGKKRYIHSRFWTDTYIDCLDPIEKLLFLYFLTNERVNIAGIYELPLKIMAVETGIEKEMVEKILKRFEKEKKMFYINGWVYLKNFQKYQNLDNLSISKGIENVMRDIPLEITEKMKLIDESIPTRTPLPTKLESKSKSKLESKSINMSVTTDAFNQFWEVYPKKELKKKTEEIWRRKKLDVHLVVILEFIIKAKDTDRWKKGFVKQPSVFLNGECWNDDLTSYQDRSTNRGKSVAIIN